MALTEYDKKHLSSNAQNKILAATKKWNDANAKGDTKGMAAAQAEAAAVRKSAGYHSNPDGTYGGSYVSTSGTKNTSGGGSPGGSSNKNSQYSAPILGDTWDNTTNYQTIINEAVKNGDYVTAAKAEQLRNQKITSTGSNYNTTNMYAGYLDNNDYGSIGQQQIANGASWEDVLNTYNSRYNKAVSTEGLEKYANDEIQQMMWNYIVDNMKKSNQPDDFAYDKEQPEYDGKYDNKISRILNEILNRDDFSYDVMNDPLYQQYAAMYQREGDRAMKNTLAEAAAGAGGMNTYAITAAQQANSYYNSQLADKVPELYQLAYQMYLNDLDLKVQDLGILQDMDATQYNRYRDTMNDWYNDRNFAYGVYQDDVQQGNWNTNFDYNTILDNRNYNNNEYWANKEWDYNDYWTNKEWDESQADKEYDRNLYDKEMAIDEVWRYIEMGVAPSADLIAKAGMSESDVQAAVAAVKAEQARSAASSIVASGGSSGGGSSSSGGNSSSGIEDNDNGYEGFVGGPQEPVKPREPEEGAAEVASGLVDLGLGLVHDETLINELAKAGGIYEKDGKLMWSDGWNKDNYRDNLKLKPFPYLMSPLNYEVYK